MNEIEQSRSRPPVVKRVAAGLVLVIVAALAIKLVASVIFTIITIVVVVALVAAVIWALNTIL